MLGANEVTHRDNGDGEHVFNGAVTNIMKILENHWEYYILINNTDNTVTTGGKNTSKINKRSTNTDSSLENVGHTFGHSNSILRNRDRHYKSNRYRCCRKSK
jgi:hypothetical protein